MKQSDRTDIPQHIYNHAMLEVNPERMKDIAQHVSVFEPKRIIANRNDYLNWM